MKSTGVFLLAVLALSAVRAEVDDIDDFADSACGNGKGAPGGWSPVNLGNLSLVEKLAPVVKQAVLDFVAENASMINCPDSYDIDADYACSQVVAGMNYRVFLSVDCDDNEDATETANDSLSLEAIIYVPLEGTPNVTIVRRGAVCSEFDDTNAKCYIGDHVLDCSATSWTKAPSVVCSITNKHTQKEVFVFNCPLNGTAVNCDITGLEKLPASVKDYVSNILAKWSAVAPADSDFLDFLDDGDLDGSDDDSSDDYGMDKASSIGDYSTSLGMDDGPMDGGGR